MPDALDITTDIRFDKEDPYVGDPFYVDITVLDTDGNPVNASLTVEAQHYPGTAADQDVKGSADSNGEATLSLSVPATRGWEVYVRAQTSQSLGTTRAGFINVQSDPDVPNPTGGRLLYSKNTIAAGTH